MTNRCAFKDGKRRCSRNGFGNPPLCRAHAVQIQMDGTPSWFNILEMADRAFSKSNNETVQQVRSIFGDYLAGTVNSSNARQVPPPEAPTAPPPAPEDPRVILMFEPGEQLTAERVKARKRELASLCHPDKQGGSISAMKRVNEAADALLKSL